MRHKMVAAATRHAVAAALFLGSLPLFAFFGLAVRFEWALIGPAMLVVRRLQRAPRAVAGTVGSGVES